MLYQKTTAKKIIADKVEINRIVNETIHSMANIVGATLGTAGRSILIERDGMSPLISKDGVTVARALGVDRAEDNIVIEAAKEICINTAKEAGDGTTTAIVLASAIVKYGQEFISSHPKCNPQRVVSELQELYREVIVKYLSKYAVKAENEKQLCDVARISANGDDEIAKAAVEAVLAAGDDGKVLIEESQDGGMRVEKIDGYIVTSGLKDLGNIGPVFINDRGNQQVKVDQGLIFLYDGSMHDLNVPGAIQQILEAQGYAGTPFIVFAHDFSDLVLDRFAKTNKGGVTAVPIKTPFGGFSNSRSTFLYDMAAYTSGKVLDPANAPSIGDMKVEEVFGNFSDARVTMYETFISNDVNTEAVEIRINELKSLVKAALNEHDKMHLRTMISKLTCGVSTIWVGGSSELEIREKKARVEDAVEAVRSAIAEGIIPGGAIVPLVLANLIDNKKKKKESWSIMSKALREPFRLLMLNCGEDPDDIYDNQLKKYVEKTVRLPKRVFDSNMHEVVNPFKAGIIEPAKVCRVCVSNALSVAGLLITLGGIVVVPRDAQLEQQLTMADNAFKSMMKDAQQEG
jgi:chaperonin GroEL